MVERFAPVVDGEPISAVHHPASGDRWLVFCHGFLSDKSGSYADRCRRAVEAGYDAVRFDFRGCGESTGDFTEQTLSDKLADLQAVVDSVDPDRYALFGSSFGAKVAFHTAATDERVVAVATRAPVTYNRAFDSYRHVVERDGRVSFEDGRAIDAEFFADFEAYDFERAASSLTVPVAIFHGRDDDSVALADSFDAARALPGDVLVEAFAGEGHRFSNPAEQRLQSRLFEWLGTAY